MRRLLGLTIPDQPNPAGVGDDQFDESRSGCLYCAEVKQAMELHVHVNVWVPTTRAGTKGTQMTQYGLQSVWGHEARRLAAWKAGHDAYLVPAEGALATRCGRVCRGEPGEAQALLSAYLAALRSVAIQQYNSYTAIAQGWISRENQRQRPYVNGMMDGYDWIGPPLPTPPLTPPPCPSSDP